MRGQASEVFQMPAVVSDVSWPMRRIVRVGGREEGSKLVSSLWFLFFWFVWGDGESWRWKASMRFSATHLLREYPSGDASSGFVETCSAIGYLETGVLVTEAVEERKRNRMGSALLGAAVVKSSKCVRPAIWSFSNERKRAVKLTAHAAWMMTVVVFPRWVYVSGERPRAGLERLQGRQITVGVAVAESSSAADEGSLMGEKGGRPGLARAVSDLETRSWAASGEEARTRQVI